MAVIACSIFPSLGRKGKWLPRHHSFSGEKRKTIDDVFCFVTDDVFFCPGVWYQSAGLLKRCEIIEEGRRIFDKSISMFHTRHIISPDKTHFLFNGFQFDCIGSDKCIPIGIAPVAFSIPPLTLVLFIKH